MDMSMTELLKQAFGATEEQLAAFAGEMRANGIYTASEENLDIRYGKLKNDYEAMMAQRDAEKAAADQLRDALQGQDRLQAEILQRDAAIGQLQEELGRIRLDAAIRMGLLAEQVKDVDYVVWKLREDQTALKLDENGAVVGWEETLANLKRKLPGMFGDGDAEERYEIVDPLPVLRGSAADAITPGAFRRMDYDRRAELKRNSELMYRTLKGSL